MSKRENGAGSVYKRKDSKVRPWMAVAPATYTDEGKPKRIVIGHYATAKEAKEALMEYVKNPTELYNATVKEVFDLWSEKAFKDMGKSAIDGYIYNLPKIAPVFNMKMRDLKTYHMQKIIDSHIGKSDSALQKIKTIFMKLFRFSMENDICDKNYAQFLVLPKYEKKEKEAFSEIEMKKIENAVGKIRFADMILAMCYTGFRLTEFLELTKDSYDPVNKTLRGGKKTAAGKNRIVPVHPKIQGIIEDWIAKDGDVIFCTERGKIMNLCVFRNSYYYPALEKIGVRKLTPHSTRHTCATMLSASGARPEDIQKILGHSNYDITAGTYIHQSTETLKKAMSLVK